MLKLTVLIISNHILAQKFDLSFFLNNAKIKQYIEVWKKYWNIVWEKDLQYAHEKKKLLDIVFWVNTSSYREEIMLVMAKI